MVRDSWKGRKEIVEVGSSRRGQIKVVSGRESRTNTHTYIKEKEKNNKDREEVFKVRQRS